MWDFIFQTIIGITATIGGTLFAVYLMSEFFFHTIKFLDKIVIWYYTRKEMKKRKAEGTIV